MNSRKQGFHSSNNRGFALVEVLIASAILAFIIAALASYVSNQATFAMKIEGAANCRNETEMLVKDFANASDTQVANYIQSTYSANDTVIKSYGTRKEAAFNNNTLLVPWPTPSGGKIYSSYGNFQNIENSATRALQIYNAFQPGICGNGLGVKLTPQNSFMFTNSTAVQKLVSSTTKDYYINIIPINLATGAPLACGTSATQTWMSPLSYGNSLKDVGMQVTITVQPKASPSPSDINQVTANSCVGQTTVKYNSDFKAPVLNPTPGTTPVTSMDCSTDTLTVSGLVSSEPGSVFECSVDNGINWFYCNSSTALGGNVSVILENPGINQASTRADVKVTPITMPLPLGATFLVRPVDTAGNRPTVNPASYPVNFADPMFSPAPCGGTAVGGCVLPVGLTCGTGTQAYVASGGGCGTVCPAPPPGTCTVPCAASCTVQFLNHAITATDSNSLSWTMSPDVTSATIAFTTSNPNVGVLGASYYLPTAIPPGNAGMAAPAINAAAVTPLTTENVTLSVTNVLGTVTCSDPKPVAISPAASPSPGKLTIAPGRQIFNEVSTYCQASWYKDEVISGGTPPYTVSLAGCPPGVTFDGTSTVKIYNSLTSWNVFDCLISVNDSAPLVSRQNVSADVHCMPTGTATPAPTACGPWNGLIQCSVDNVCPAGTTKAGTVISNDPAAILTASWNMTGNTGDIKTVTSAMGTLPPGYAFTSCCGGYEVACLSDGTWGFYQGGGCTATKQLSTTDPACGGYIPPVSPTPTPAIPTMPCHSYFVHSTNTPNNGSSDTYYNISADIPTGADITQIGIKNALLGSWVNNGNDWQGHLNDLAYFNTYVAYNQATKQIQVHASQVRVVLAEVDICTIGPSPNLQTYFNLKNPDCYEDPLIGVNTFTPQGVTITLPNTCTWTDVFGAVTVKDSHLTCTLGGFNNNYGWLINDCINSGTSSWSTSWGDSGGSGGGGSGDGSGGCGSGDGAGAGGCGY